MSEHDPVNSPSHYTQGGVEVIEAIEAWQLGYRLGNAVKYIARAGKKDPAKTIEDLSKARWYLNREIANLSHECIDAVETNMEAIDRLVGLTGLSEADVLGEALNLYEDSLDGEEETPAFAKGDLVKLASGENANVGVIHRAYPSGKVFTVCWGEKTDGAMNVFLSDHEDHELVPHEVDEESDEPESFKVGDPVAFAIEDEFPATGVVREVRHDNPYYVVDWKEADGTEWSDEHWGHELVARETETTYPADPSKTAVCYRCTKCGMPIVAGCEKRTYNIFGELAPYHESCFLEDQSEGETKAGKPKFAPGDKVTSEDCDDIALVYEVTPDGNRLCVFWLDDGSRGSLLVADAILVED